MAAADVQTFNPLAIAGLGKILDTVDMNASQVLYNGLRNIRDQPPLQVEHVNHVKAVLKIIQLHGMGDHFGVHVAHRHNTIPFGTVRLEADMGINGFTWTKPTSIERPDASKMHATFFKVGQDGLVPFEFSEGPSPIDVTKVPAAFLAEFAAYITKHELADLIVLEVGDFTKRAGIDSKSKAEIEVQWGENTPFTVVVPTAFLKPDAGDLIGTGWSVPGTVEPDKPDPGTQWLKVDRPKDTHKVYVKSIMPVTPELLVKALGEQGIIIV